MSTQYYCAKYCPFCRPVGYLLNINKVPHKENHIDLRKQEHKKEEYTKINPFQKVPAIVDGDYIIYESNTVMRYLCNSKTIDDHWYPKDAKQRAQVDLYFDWHAANIFDILKVSMVKLGYNKTLSLEEATKVADKGLENLVHYFLSRHKYLASDENPTIADLALIFHLGSQLNNGLILPQRVLTYIEDLYKNQPKLKEDVEGYVADTIKELSEREKEKEAKTNS